MSTPETARLRIVVDTNIVMGGLINPHRSSSGLVVRLWLEDRVEVLVSPEIRGEYLDISSKMRFGRPEAVREREQKLQHLLVKARTVEPGIRFDCVPEDPADNRFLECAVAGGADCILTQDRHLLNLVEFQGGPDSDRGQFHPRARAQNPVRGREALSPQ